jgi:hypothetical protein
MKIQTLLFGAALATVLAVLAGCVSAGTPTGASDPQGERLQQAYHILAKCDFQRDDHIDKAMKHTKDAAKLLGTDIENDGIKDTKEGDCDQHLHNVQEMLRLAHVGLPVNGDKRAVITIGAALREVTAALEAEKK